MTEHDERAVIGAVPRQLLIGGAWVDPVAKSTFGVEDPSTGETLVEVADGDGVDALLALDAAVGAATEWAASPPRQRSELLRATYQQLVDRTDELALLMTLEMGKPVAESKAEIAYASEFFRWFAEEAVRIDGHLAIAPQGGARMTVTHQPVGPCLLITPWNFPMAMAARKVAPAMAAGCTSVLKPAELTPLSALALGAILLDVGVPPGVVNMITTTDAASISEPLMADPRLRKLSFTGSTAVGRTLIAQAAPNVLRVSMELGGNAPFLVFADADLDAAVDGAVIAKMRNGGEACTSANRFLVHASLRDAFAERLAERLEAMPMGRGTESGVELGPLIEAKARDKVAALVDDAVAGGAKVLTGGKVPSGPGWFYPATVLVDVPADARLLREEIFGPVAPIVSFDDDDEAIAAANDTEFGLVAYLYTRDLDRARRVTEALESGMVGVNQGMVSNPAAPFGGVKQSGLGREGGHEGIFEYLTTKYTATAAP